MFRWLLTICILPVGHLTPLRSCRQATPLRQVRSCIQADSHHQMLYCFSYIEPSEVIFGHMAHRTQSQVDLHFTKLRFQNAGRGETVFLNAVTGGCLPASTAQSNETLSMLVQLLTELGKQSTDGCHCESSGLHLSCCNALDNCGKGASMTF